MIHESQVREFVGRLAREFCPQQVIWFGSLARGSVSPESASPDSDVDLLVIMPTSQRASQQALEIRRRLACSFPLDLLVKTPEEVARRLALHDCFLTTVLAEGKTLYESPRP
jgi:uncharacterized protein